MRNRSMPGTGDSGRRRASIALAAVTALAFAASAGAATAAASPKDGMASVVRPGPGVTSVRRLSDWEPSLRATPGDTRVFVLDSGKPGGTMLVVGGTHADEAAGIVAALLIVENALPSAGRIIVIPWANNSASSDGPRGAGLMVIRTPRGRRVVKTGGRLTAQAHQGEPDPRLFFPPGSWSALDGAESRNLDRAYPGAPDGPLTARVAFGIMSILRDERVDVAVDLHETAPDSPLAMSIIAHDRGLGLAALAALDLGDRGIAMRVESSPAGYQGLSHREWGDRTGALAYLVETPAPPMADGGLRDDPDDNPAHPLWRRVAVHLETIGAIIRRYDESAGPGASIEYGGVPGADGLELSGIGRFLR